MIETRTTYPRRLSVAGWAIGLSLLSGCAAAPEPDLASDHSAIADGVRETRFPGAGFLMMRHGAGVVIPSLCTLALIAPRVAVTAAHCVTVEPRPDDAPTLFASKYSAGFGLRPEFDRPDLDEVLNRLAESGAVRSVIVPKMWIGPHEASYGPYDIALLVLEHDAPVASMSIAEPAVGAARVVGYGQTNVGSTEFESRRSAAF